jgi:hypothetical protein
LEGGKAGPDYQIFQINEIGEEEILTGKHEGHEEGREVFGWD